MSNLTRTLYRKNLLLVVISILVVCTLLPSVGRTQDKDGNKQKVVRQVAQGYIQAGEKLYEKGSYEKSERQLLFALDYQQYLTDEELTNVNALLAKVQSEVDEQEKPEQTDTATEEQALEQVENEVVVFTGDEQNDTDEMIEAQAPAYTETAPAEEKVIAEDIIVEVPVEIIDETVVVEDISDEAEVIVVAEEVIIVEQADEMPVVEETIIISEEAVTETESEVMVTEEVTAEIAEDDIVIVYEAQTPNEDDAAVEEEPVLVAVDDTVAEEIVVIVEEAEDMSTEEAVAIVEAKTEAPAPVEEEKENSYISLVNKKRNLVRGHTAAVVNDTIYRANNHLTNKEFDKGIEELAKAKGLVSDNQLFLGPELYQLHTDKLNETNDELKAAKQTQAITDAQARQEAAIASQEKYRTQMEADRLARVKELMSNAHAYQKQQRYESALGQLESLLVLDPFNEDALVLRDVLKDTISFRNQLKQREESRKERMALLGKINEASIPYADELSYSKTWREIDARRTGEQAMGQAPEDELIYDQLDRIVDLSSLEPEMPLSEAIDYLRNSVQPPLKLLVNWNDLLENAEIDQSTPANMDPISGVPLVTALDSMLEFVAGGFAELGYIVENGVIKIATKDSLQVSLETRVFDVSVHVSQPAEFYGSLSSGNQGGSGGGSSGGSGGGSSGGGGSGGGSSGGSGGQSFGESFGDDDSQRDIESIRQEAQERAETLITLIKETIEPDSWFEAGGDGSITLYGGKKLVVLQTRAVHKKVEELLKEMRKALGEQVSIEAKFLLVAENFLEDIGLDIDFGLWNGGKGKWSAISVENSSFEAVKPTSTDVSGTLAETLSTRITGSYGSILNDLQVAFVLRATQAHRESKTLTAPKVTVLSGESATFRAQRPFRYVLPPDVGSSTSQFTGGGGNTNQNIRNNYNTIPIGTVLNVTPTITPDKKHVLLNIETQKTGLLEFTSTTIEIPDIVNGTTISQTIEMPQTEISRVQTRVNVPDGGTLLLGGQKVSSEVEKEVGTPILSKIPFFGRLFGNRGNIKDDQILLILVKPTIILQEETDADALGVMDRF
jgi:type II secretory pathway component GspD/PulD (secretin)/tetratricopeptide (TPR) repeat protein